jgi:hypothetical protein
MRVIESDRLSHWASAGGLVALGGLAWVLYVPGGRFWSAALAAGLVGSALATMLLVRQRAVPSLAQVVASAEAEPVATPAGGRGQADRPGLGMTGERKP